MLVSALRAVRRVSAVPALLLSTSAVAALYDSYRYPLRINNATTSPTYRNTPLDLQAGKYVVLAVLALILLGYVIRNRRIFAGPRSIEIALGALCGYAFVRACIASLSSHSLASLEVVLPFVCGAPFVLVATLWIIAAPGRAASFIRGAARFGGGVVLLHAIVNTAEIGAWATTGRLPALAYAHGLVRFGGLWDDPNGTAAFSALVATAVLGGALGVRRRVAAIVLTAALLNLIVAWSFSGWLLFLIGLIGVGVPRFGWRRVSGALALLGAAVALVVGLAAVSGTNIHAAAATKFDSAAQRLHLSHHFAGAGSAVGWLVGMNHPHRFEDAFGTWLSTTGVVGLALFVVWLVAALWSVARCKRYWLLVGGVGFVVASAFVPLFLVFPVGLFFLIAVSAGGAGHGVGSKLSGATALAEGSTAG